MTVGFVSLVVALLAAGTGRGLQRGDGASMWEATALEDAAPPAATSPAPLLDDSLVTGTALLEEFFGDSLSHLPKCVRPYHPRCFDLDVVIVALPDPIDSYLDWAFDADLESMRRAFESAQYVTNRFWLPWNEDRRAVQGRAPTRYRRSHPGVFLFRNTNPGRARLKLAYVVGEISTGGVHKRALEVALDERARLFRTGRFVDTTGARDTIRFVGPFFTGSALSTRLTLEKWRAATGDSSFALFVSGAASGTGILTVFDSSADAIRPAWRMSFHATVNADVTLTAAMLRVIVDSRRGLGIPPDHVALVQESSTQYGQQSAGRSYSADSPLALQVPAVTGSRDSRLSDSLRLWSARLETETKRMLVIPYPMSISSLRAEYANHPAAPNRTQQFERGEAPRIPLALHDSNRQLESPVPVAQLTPASLELMIQEITRTLRAHDIRAIGLIGTDVRDKIFIADELRKRLPDARLFTFGSNDLYLRSDFNNALRGMLVFSTYPLFLENQWWDMLTRERPRRLAFASDDAQGTFNATLRQLGRPWLREYAAPFDSVAKHPPVWVTAVGRHSFIPIQTLDGLSGADEYLEGRDPSKAIAVRRGNSASDSSSTERHASQSEWLVRLMFIAAFVAIFFFVLRADALSRVRVPISEASSESDATFADTTIPLTTEERATTGLAGASFLSRRRRGLRAALLMHREIYTFLRHLALLCTFAALAVVLFPRSDENTLMAWFSPVLFALLPLMPLAALAAFAVRTRAVWADWGGAYRDYVYRPPRKWIERELARAGRLLSRMDKNPLRESLSLLTPSVEYEIRALAPRAERSVWRREGIVIAILATIGVLYTVAVATLVVDLRLRGLPDATLFLHRAIQLDSGVSPIFPIVLSSAALAVLCSWQLSRITLLDEVTPFEEAFQQHARKTALNDSDEIKSRIARGVHDARLHLSRIIPDLPSGLAKLLAVLLLVVLVSGLWIHFQPSLESITAFRRTGSYTTFDVVFRLSVIMIFASAAWALARLIMVWRSLCITLRALGSSPLVTAFERLPRRVSRLTRLTLFGDPSRGTVLGVTATQWTHLRGLFKGNEKAFEAVSAEAAGDVRMLMAEEAPLHGRDHRRAGLTFARELRQMLALIERFWELEPAETQVGAVIADLKAQKTVDGASTSGRIRRSFPDEARLWVRSAEEFIAVQAVDYIAWVLRHLRRLVLMLLFLLVLTMALLSSYSFLPQTVVRSLFLLLFIGIVVSLLLVLSQMNRDEVMSRVTRTDPGRINWNSGFLLNIGMVIALPVLSLVSAFSPLRTDLFGWLDGLLRLLSKR